MRSPLLSRPLLLLLLIGTLSCLSRHSSATISQSSPLSSSSSSSSSPCQSQSHCDTDVLLSSRCSSGGGGAAADGDVHSFALSPFPNASIGIIGLGVMGENLALNLDSHGFRVALYNRNVSKVADFVGPHGPGFDKPNITGTATLCEFVAALAVPRVVMILIKAGPGVDDLIDQLVPLLAPGDVIIDGGNSNFHDSNRRAAALAAHGLHFVGAGISSGEEGALSGLSIMPGGSADAWPIIQPILTAIAARVENTPCCDWVGNAGAGHYVKMLHNGLEYCEMQILAESYHLLRDYLGLDTGAIGQVFGQWRTTEIWSYLLEITAQIFNIKVTEPQDPFFNQHLIEIINDVAGQKGTGRWTIHSALDLGVPMSLVAEAVFARYLSTEQHERHQAAACFPPAAPWRLLDDPPAEADRLALLDDLADAIMAARLVSYAQGYRLLRVAAHEFQWEFDYAKLALIWRGGLISSDALRLTQQAFVNEPQLENLLLHPLIVAQMQQRVAGWRRLVVRAIQAGIPVPLLSSALSFFDGLRSARSPANLIQAQRDFFGAHTFERIDAPGQPQHFDWSEARCFQDG